MQLAENWAIAPSRSIDTAVLNGTLSWQLLDQVGCGICIVDEQLRLSYSNAHAQATYFFKWFTSNGVFQAPPSEANARELSAALRNALFGKPSLVQCVDEGSCVILALSPIDLEHRRVGALITSERVQVNLGATFRMYAHTLGLTTKETVVLCQLARGREPKRVAHELNLSIETIRSHIKAILSKASSNSLRELLLRVATLPPSVTQHRDSMNADKC